MPIPSFVEVLAKALEYTPSDTQNEEFEHAQYVVNNLLSRYVSFCCGIEDFELYKLRTVCLHV